MVSHKNNNNDGSVDLPCAHAAAASAAKQEQQKQQTAASKRTGVQMTATVDSRTGGRKKKTECISDRRGHSTAQSAESKADPGSLLCLKS